MSPKLDYSLSRFVLFDGLAPSMHTDIAPLIYQKDFVAGEPVFAEGDHGDALFLVSAGVFDIHVRSADNDEVVVASFREGDLFGEMAFFDQYPRSAGCRAKVDGQVLLIGKDAFSIFQKQHPSISSKILNNLYGIITNRLLHTNSFLSDMVQWGEDARKRSITDPLTGLFNRRYCDDFVDTLIFDSNVNGSEFIVVMIDIDNFGIINRDLGAVLADECVGVLAQVVKQVLSDEHTAARYGGDEFVVILPHTTIDEATAVCAELRAELAQHLKVGNPAIRSAPVTLSQGIACFPMHARSRDDLFVATDTALYLAKEGGKNRSMVFDPSIPNVRMDKKIPFQTVPPDVTKTDIPTIAQRNKVINNITNALLHRDSFLMLGHIGCDEDCLASMVACALLLKKFQKEVSICAQVGLGSKSALLHRLCTYNDISFLSPTTTVTPDSDTVIICDTAKPTLLDAGPAIKACLSNPSILKIEIDHHLGADSRYLGNHHYCLVQQASSTCELVLLLCLKVRHMRESLVHLNIRKILTRNMSLALAIGLLTDTHNGKILHGKRAKKIFDAAVRILNRPLKNNTFDASKVTSVMDIMRMDDAQSPTTVRLEHYFTRRVKQKPRLRYVILHRTESEYLARIFEYTLIQSASRIIVDRLAEESRFFGLVGYIVPHDHSPSGFIMQCRLRRSLAWGNTDLRTILQVCNIEDGGGHEGAVGFRFPAVSDKETNAVVTRIIEALHDQSA